MPRNLHTMACREFVARYWVALIIIGIAIFFTGRYLGMRDGIRIGGVFSNDGLSFRAVTVVGPGATICFDGPIGQIPRSIRVEYVEMKSGRVVKTETISVQSLNDGKPLIQITAPEASEILAVELRRG